MIKRIPLTNLLLDKELQVRPVDQEHLQRLVNSDPAQWPELKVISQTDATGSDTGKFYIVAGQHRYLAAQEKNVTALDCEIIEDYSDDIELQIAGYADNMKHGLPLSMQERKAYAVLLKQKHPTLSNAEISRRAGIDNHTVATAFKTSTQIQANTSIQASTPTPGFTSAQARIVKEFIDNLLDSDAYDMFNDFSSTVFGDIAARHILQSYSSEYYSNVSSVLRVLGSGLMNAGKQLK